MMKKMRNIGARSSAYSINLTRGGSRNTMVAKLHYSFRPDLINAYMSCSVPIHLRNEATAVLLDRMPMGLNGRAFDRLGLEESERLNYSRKLC